MVSDSRSSALHRAVHSFDPALVEFAILAITTRSAGDPSDPDVHRHATVSPFGAVGHLRVLAA